MSAKDSEKFCRNTPEKPEEKNKKKFVFKNHCCPLKMWTVNKS